MKAAIEVAFVAAGAAGGGICRWAVNRLLLSFQPFFPFATLTVNLTSSFLAGLFAGIVLLKHPENTHIKPLLITGFCGGFSTFSTLSFETLTLFQQGRFVAGFLNIILNVTLCLLATWAGIYCIK